MDTMRRLHEAAQELEFFHKQLGEFTPVARDERVFFVTPEGDFPGTARVAWEPSIWPGFNLQVQLDCDPKTTLAFHRSLFRVYNVLDLMTDV